MFQRNALTTIELESIQASPTEGEAAQFLLQILLSQPFEMFACFLDSLKETRQTDVYISLVDKGVHPYRRFILMFSL